MHSFDSRSPSLPRRHPFADVTSPVNSQQPCTRHPMSTSIDHSSPRLPHHLSLLPNGNLRATHAISPISDVEDKRLSALTGEYGDSNPNSQISTTSTNASNTTRKCKRYIGPWHLGKDLGKGATGRVRLAKHVITQQAAAIKIVSRKQAQTWRSQSIANMDATRINVPVSKDDRTALPFGLEREIIIMKLMDHPNIIKLYDVWENRSELYLAMELVECGELFNYIAQHGCLDEQETVRIHRQVISGLAYCHSIHLCHRDIKPENILLDRDRNVKIADFGMAALQPDGKWLTTSCGSPHYAPPEIARGQPYQGDRADIWSCGVVMYVMLCGRLPFGTGEEGENICEVLDEVKRCEVIFPSSISPEAQDFVLGMLQRQPMNRIAIADMWSHPLIHKYDVYIGHPGFASRWQGGPPRPLTDEDCGAQIMRRKDIDNELLKSLCTLWQTIDGDEVAASLLAKEPNHEKVFYNSLLKFREEQLEYYQGPNLEFSASDYHHVTKPPIRRSSTRSTLRRDVQQRQRSQFSIVNDTIRRPSQVSRRAMSETGTEQSYDPYRPSRHQLVNSQADHSRITVLRGISDASGHRHPSGASASLRHPALAKIQDNEVYINTSSPPGLPTAAELHHLRRVKVIRGYSKSSLASSQRSRANSAKLRISAGYRRPVSFNHWRSHSIGQNSPPGSSPPTLHRRYVNDRVGLSSPNLPSPLTVEGPESVATQMVRSRKEAARLNTAERVAVMRPNRTSQHWRDEARQVSSELEKYCDEAFTERQTIPKAVAVETTFHSLGYRHPTPDYVSGSEAGKIPKWTRHRSQQFRDVIDSYAQRPLPPPPGGHYLDPFAHDELSKARKNLKRRAADLGSGAFDGVIAQLDRLMQSNYPKHATCDSDRRAASAPDPKAASSSLLPPVGEEEERLQRYTDKKMAARSSCGYRAASAPTAKGAMASGNSSVDAGAEIVKSSIRLVDVNFNPTPHPLVIRKRSGGSSNQEDIPQASKPSSNTPPSNPSTTSSWVTANDVVTTRPQSRLGFTERGSAAGFAPFDRLMPLEEDGDKENVDPRPASGQVGEGKLKGWFKRQQIAQKRMEQDRGPTPPMKDERPRPKTDSRRETGLGGRSNFTPSDGPGNGWSTKPRLKVTRKIFRLFSKDTTSTPDIMRIGDDDLTDGASFASSSILSHDRGSSSAAVPNDCPSGYRGNWPYNRGYSQASAVSKKVQPQTLHWLARFLHVRPAKRILAFQVPRVRALREIRGVLRDWKRHGMRDTVVDKDTWRIWARVDFENRLGIKPVSIACELFAVVERGKRSNFCLVRFTQEQGAKSSFEKVVQTMEGAMKGRQLLIVDKEKAKRMRKCLARSRR